MARLQYHAAPAKALDGAHVMAHKQHGPPVFGHVVHLPQALFLELRVADGEDFVYYQDLRFEVGGDGEGEAGVHAAGVEFDGGVEEFFGFGEGDDFVEFFGDFGAFHAQDGAVEVDIFAAGEFGVEAGADFQQAADAAFDFDLSFGRVGDSA